MSVQSGCKLVSVEPGVTSLFLTSVTNSTPLPDAPNGYFNAIKYIFIAAQSLIPTTK